MNEHLDAGPPEWPLKLLRFFLKEEFVEEIEGDMEEIFLSNVETSSPRRAQFIYALETLKLVRPSLLKHFKTVPTLTPYAMYKNYFKIAWRNLVKRKRIRLLIFSDSAWVSHAVF